MVNASKYVKTPSDLTNAPVKPGIYWRQISTIVKKVRFKLYFEEFGNFWKISGKVKTEIHHFHWGFGPKVFVRFRVLMNWEGGKIIQAVQAHVWAEILIILCIINYMLTN